MNYLYILVDNKVAIIRGEIYSLTFMLHVFLHITSSTRHHNFRSYARRMYKIYFQQCAKVQKKIRQTFPWLMIFFFSSPEIYFAASLHLLSIKYPNASLGKWCNAYTRFKRQAQKLLLVLNLARINPQTVLRGHEFTSTCHNHYCITFTLLKKKKWNLYHGLCVMQ